MTIEQGYELATDRQLREVGNFANPPRAGKVTELLGSGQVVVATDDPEAPEVTAWPLNGFSYAVGDVVYVAFPVNNAESAIVIGSKTPLPTLDPGVFDPGVLLEDGSVPLTANWDIGEDRRVLAEAIRARDSEGLRLENDGGGLGLVIADDGHIGINADAHANIWVDILHESLNAIRARGSAATIIAIQRANNGAGGGNFHFRKSRGSVDSESDVTNGDGVGNFIFMPYADGAFQEAALIGGAVDDTVSGSDAPTSVIIATGGNAGNRVTAVVVDSDQNVAINTTKTTSGARFLVVQPTLGGIVQRLRTTSTNDDPTLDVIQNRVTTTNATPTTLHTIAIPASNTVLITATVIARRTG